MSINLISVAFLGGREEEEDRLSLCSPGWPQIAAISSSASQVQGPHTKPVVPSLLASIKLKSPE